MDTVYDPADAWDPPYITDDLPTVCVTHLRFVPCRKSGQFFAPCSLSTHPDAVAAVRNYQEGRADA